jgi:hypothetical protein
MGGSFWWAHRKPAEDDLADMSVFLYRVLTQVKFKLESEPL